LKPLHRLVVAWLTEHPVPDEVCYRLVRFVTGEEAMFTLNRTDDWRPSILRKAQYRARCLMARWRDPDSAKRYTAKGWTTQPRKGPPTPQEILACLLTCVVFADQREWTQGNAAEFLQAKTLLKMRKLGTATSRQIEGNVLRVLSRAIGQATGGWLIGEARKFIAAQEAKQKTIASLAHDNPSPKTLDKPTTPHIEPPSTPRYVRPVFRYGNAAMAQQALAEWTAVEAQWKDYYRKGGR
jgi:hypothetical protein